jgi:hypothetical protein
MAKGKYLLAGPDWKGEVPKGITKLIRADTQFVFVGYRTQLFDPEDMVNVKKVQAGYTVQPLSQFLGTPPASSRTQGGFPAIQPRESRVGRLLRIPQFHPAILPDRSGRQDRARASRRSASSRASRSILPRSHQRFAKRAPRAWRGV